MTLPKLSDRKFGLIFAAIFTIITIIGWIAFDLVLLWAIVCSGFFLVLSLIIPSALMPLNRLWAALTRRIHLVVNFTLLASFFYLFILPYALVMKLFGRDTMRRKRVQGSATYWQPVTRHTNETTLADMF